MNPQHDLAADGPLDQQVRALWAQQLQDWPMLASGATALDTVQTRELDVLGRRLNVQWNPGRIVSTGAKIDAAAIARRPCFLCRENQPAQQRGIAFGDGWRILCNPAPILAPHFTVARARHEPQRFVPALGAMLDLAAALGDDFTVIYNGPTSGASAPDHVHLQAVPAGRLPLEALVCDEEARSRAFSPLSAVGGWLGVSQGEAWPVIAGGGVHRAALEAIIARVIMTLADVRPAQPEPALNAYVRRSGPRWTFWATPRARHRPICYGEGAGQFLVSPGAIDMAGVLITPRQEDFERLTPDAAGRILREVSLPPGEWSALRRMLGRAGTF